MSRRSEDTFNILVATDIHLGFSESDPIRGEDSFNTFEEILTIAQKNDVDFILLGGDLFHENKPSNSTLFKCISLIRKYCMGDKPVSIEFLSNQEEIFKHCSSQYVNYEDPNLNISIPVFSIHGNHDDPAGHNYLGSMDVLSSTGHINYFSKCTDLTQVNLTPLLLKKGSTKLALYGLSHIKDERLARLFKDKKVEFQRPSTDPCSWCSVMILHQNRADRGVNKFVKEEMLPSFLQLVIWGHEHECRVIPEYNAQTGFRVIQPGSPVATSLSEGESANKHVALVKVHSTDVLVEPIELETVRPFMFETIDLSKVNLDIVSCKPAEQVSSYVAEKVESLLRRARDKHSGHALQPKLPLIRINVEYNDEKQYFNKIRFGQRYIDRVANPDTLLNMKRDKRGKRGKKGDHFDLEAMEAAVGKEKSEIDSQEEIGSKVGKLIDRYFSDELNNKKMSILTTTGITEAVSRYIEKDDKYALETVIDHQKMKAVEYLKSRNDLFEENFAECIEEFCQMRTASTRDDEAQEISNAIEKCRDNTFDNGGATLGSDSDEEMMTVPVRGKGRGNRGGARKSSTRGRGSPGKKVSSTKRNMNVDDIGSDDGSVVSSKSRGRGYKAANTTRATRGRRVSSNTSTRGSRNTSQMSIQDIFASEVSLGPVQAKRRKMTFESDSD